MFGCDRMSDICTGNRRALGDCVNLSDMGLL